MVTRRQLKKENEQLKHELEEACKKVRYYKDALASLKNPNFKKFKDMSLGEVMDKVNRNDISLGEAVYLFAHVIPLTIEGSKKIERFLGEKHEVTD